MYTWDHSDVILSTKDTVAMLEVYCVARVAAVQRRKLIHDACKLLQAELHTSQNTQSICE